jgi:tryptophanyl-tRNA synthetase
VYAFHKIFNQAEVDEIGVQCRAGTIGCVECKKRLADRIVDYLADVHVRRQELEKNPGRVTEILTFGAERARKVAAATMQEVKQAMHLA